MRTSELLRAAWAKIDTPGKWCKNGFENSTEKCLDSLGALYYFYADENYYNAKYILKKCCQEEGARTITEYNDAESTTHDDIKRVWMRAIELAEEDEKCTQT